MAHFLIILIIKTIAAVYGLLALAVSVLYSLSRPDSWRRSTEGERRNFDKECGKLWSLSNFNDGLSHNFLTLENGLQMHYLATKSTPAPNDCLIIFLHGFPDTCFLWEHFLRSGLASKAKLVALDLPGCGGSDSHSLYGPDQILNAVAQAIVQLKGRYLHHSPISKSSQRSILVSHDWGGVVAFRLAGETAGLVDEFIVINSSYPLAAKDQVSTLLSQTRRAISAGNFQKAWAHLQPICNQLLKSNYIFMLNLRLPLARWLPWVSASLVKVAHEFALRNTSNATGSTYTRFLAASYGPSPLDSTSYTPSGTSYGSTVKHRAEKIPQGDWDERVRIYCEGLALGEWRPSYPDFQAPMWKSSPGNARKGAFNYPVHVMFGMQDVALDPRVVVDGIENYMLGSENETQAPTAETEDGVEIFTAGRSSIVKLWASGHWSMLDAQGARILEGILMQLIGRSK